MDRLNQLECDIATYYAANMLELENKYQLLMNNLIDQKKLIQQKLQQRFMNQMKHVLQLKLTADSPAPCGRSTSAAKPNRHQQPLIALSTITAAASFASARVVSRRRSRANSRSRGPMSSRNDEAASKSRIKCSRLLEVCASGRKRVLYCRLVVAPGPCPLKCQLCMCDHT